MQEICNFAKVTGQAVVVELSGGGCLGLSDARVGVPCQLDCSALSWAAWSSVRAVMDVWAGASVT